MISHEIFEENRYYNIYNKAVGNELLFRLKRNYIFFMERYKKYIVPFADTLAFCLLPNHFHFLVRIKKLEVHSNPCRNIVENFSKQISVKFSHLFNSYAQAINKQEQRIGSLFKNRFKRKGIDSEDYLKRLILYIHSNPVPHNYCNSIEE